MHFTPGFAMMRWFSFGIWLWFAIVFEPLFAAESTKVEFDTHRVAPRFYPINVSVVDINKKTIAEGLVSKVGQSLSVTLAADQKYLWTLKSVKGTWQQSGMILTVAPKTDRNRYLEVKWPADLKEAKFYLRLVNLGDLSSSISLSTDDRVFIERGSGTGLIYITAKRNNQFVAFDEELFESLELVQHQVIEKIPEPKLEPHPMPAPNKSKPKVKPERNRLRDDIVIDTFKNPPPALLRRPFLQFNGKYAKESFTVVRDDSFDSPNTSIVGGGIEAFYQSELGFYTSFVFDSHGTETSYGSSSVKPPSKTQKRYDASLTLGVDVLNIDTRDEQQFLGIGLTYHQRQLPLDRDDQTVRAIGLQVAYGYFFEEWEFRARLGLDQRGSRNVFGATAYKLTENFAIECGLFTKRTVVVGKDRSDVRGEDVNARFNETGLTGGLRYSF